MNWFRHPLGRRKIYDDLSQEIEQHLVERTEELMAQGLSQADAAHAARREFGNVTNIEERSRDVWQWPVLDSLIRDGKFAVRQLRRNRGFACTAILTMALGIGTTTAIFSLINAVLLQPLPFPHSERLTWIRQQDHSQPVPAAETLSYPDYFDWRSWNHTFDGLASYDGSTTTLESKGEPRHLDVSVVSSNLFRVLGVAPILGRDFRPDDEKPGNRMVMLSYSLWQSAFDSAPGVSGKTIQLSGHAYTVAGVMPRNFQFPLDSPPSAMWLSLADVADGKNPKTTQRGYDSLDLVGRLRAGVSLDQGKSDLSRIAGILSRQYPDSNKWLTQALVEPELQHLIGDTKPALWVLFGAVTLLLLIACANVAGLLLARGSRRSAEFALRVSLGASRAAIVRQLLAESVILSFCGGLAGVVLAFGLLRGMVGLIPVSIPRMQDAAIDGAVLAFVMVVSIVTGLLFGVIPALRLSRGTPSQTMREGSRSVAGTRGEHRIHSSLVVAQTGIALVLLVASGLLIRSFVSMLNVNPGFDPAHVSTARIEVPFGKLSGDQHYRFYEETIARISRLPGVQSVSAGWPMPMSANHASISFQIEGRPVAKGDEPSEALGIAMPGYFATLRVPLLSGRDFGAKDGAHDPPVIIINQAMARKYFPRENPLGEHIQVELGDGVTDSAVREIVGVVGDVRGRGVTASPEPQYFLPYAQAVVTNPFLAIRTVGDPAAVLPALRAVVREMDQSVAIYQVSTLDNYVSKSMAQPRFQTLLLTCFAGVALLLAAIGMYGLLSYLVAQRALEIGLRMALGARQGDVLRMVLRRGLTLGLIGLVAGLVVSALTTRLLSGMVYGIQPTDRFTFLAATGVLLLVSLAASSLPAYRAARLDPIETLREQ
ncbi:MAG TPA: ABC transporter permease [Bryobacteraceae bacterium]|nr:ABC transporter permease [Bryobacteraceae bacterium]